jgi:hypothetical protein
VKGVAEVVFQSLPEAGRLRELRREEEMRATHILFRLIHGGVGDLDEELGVFSVDRILGYADTARSHQFVTIDLIWFCQSGQEFANHALDVALAANGRKGDDELISTEAPNDVAFAQGLAQALRNGLQELVPDVVANRIVHLLEMIEVEHEDGDAALIATGKSNALSEAVLE